MQSAAHQLPHWLVIGFSGHRALKNPEVVRGAIQSALDEITKINARLAGISSAASGADTLFAEEILRRECPLSLVLPFSIDRFEKDFAGDPAGWSRVEALCRKAIDIEVIDPTNLENDTDTAAAYMDAGYRVIDGADVVIAVWDGQPGKGFGGTADAVAYARAIGRPLIIIHPDTGDTFEERFNALDSTTHPAEDDIATIKNPRRHVEAYFTAMNEEAKRHGPRARFLVRICLQLFLAATALELSNLVFQNTGWIKWGLGGGSIVIMICALVLMSFYGKSHGRWLRCRVNAEMCRSFLATWNIRRHATIGSRFAVSALDEQEKFKDLRLLVRLDRSERPELVETKSDYAVHRVAEQIRYFERALCVAKESLRRRKLAMKISSVLAIVCSVAVFCITMRFHEHTRVSRWLQFFALTFPLLTTAIGLTLITQEAVRRAARYDEMLQSLKQLQKRLLACGTWAALIHIAAEVEEELLQELIEWRSFVRFTRDVAHHG